MFMSFASDPPRLLEVELPSMLGFLKHDFIGHLSLLHVGLVSFLSSLELGRDFRLCPMHLKFHAHAARHACSFVGMGFSSLYNVTLAVASCRAVDELYKYSRCWGYS
jgi:hypothetical protein